jgi:hypothetical protein
MLKLMGVKYIENLKQASVDIGQSVSSAQISNPSIFRNVLGKVWIDLPESVQQMHDASTGTIFTGTAKITRGRSWLAKLIAAIFRFPNEGNDVPVEVRIEKSADAEFWQRNFNGKIFRSKITSGTGKYERLICERFGPFIFGIALVLENGKLNYVVRNWRFFQIPLPGFLCPGGDSYEYSCDGKFNFNVEIKFALTGLIVSYRGWLVG